MRIDRHAKWSLCWTVGLLCLTAASEAAGVKGRFVRMEMPTPGRHYMDVAEIEILSGERNVARDGEVSALTHRALPKVVIDGDTDGKIVHSSRRGDENHWLEVDLGQTYSIDRIVLWPRTGLAYRLNGFLLSILDEKRRVVWHRRGPFARQASMALNVSPFKGRYVGTVVPKDAKGWYDIRGERRDECHYFLPPLPVVGEMALDKFEVRELKLVPPPDAAQRRKAFESRDSDAAVADLCQRFAAALDPKTAGLASLSEHCGRGDFRRALDAYRDFFFAKEIRLPFDSVPNANPYAAAELMKGRRARIVGNAIDQGEVGAPGTTAWVPQGLSVPPGVFSGYYNEHPFWKTDAGRDALRQIEFFTEVAGPYFANFDDLLRYYTATGSAEHLEQWMDYLDDWCLFGRKDIHGSPLGLTWSTEQGAYRALSRLRLLRSLAATRPEFAHDLRSTTLVRYVLALIEDLPPTTIRLKRTQLANWATMSVTGTLRLHRDWPEFLAVQYYRREAWRLWQSEWIHRNAPDGTLAEASEGPYRNVALGYFPLGFDRPWQGVSGQMQWQEMLDHARGIFRHNLGETPQTGTGFLHRDNLAWCHRQDAFFAEPETMERMEVFNSKGATGRPSVRSEMMAYGGKYILRENWQPDGEFFYMSNFRFGSQNPQLRTVYSLSRANDPLPGSGAGIHSEASPLYGYPLLVDRRGPHPKHDAIYRVGGKTVYLARAPSHVVDTRFHTSDRFDLAEAKQDAPYALRNDLWEHYWMPHAPQNRFVWGPHTAALARQNNAAVTDVVTWRQVFSVRGEHLYIVSDRIESDREHDYAACFYLNLPVPGKEIKPLQTPANPEIQIDPAAMRVRAALPERRSISLAFFASMPLRMFNRFDNNGNYELFALADKPDLEEELEAGAPIAGAFVQPHEVFDRAYPLGVHGSGRGNQVLISVHHTRPAAGADTDAARDDRRELRSLDGANGIAGFSARTRNGTQVWYQAGPQCANDLEAGPAKARAESLLVTERDGALSGVVLAAASELVLKGRAIKAPAESFEFVLSAAGAFSATPIERPIDTVRILPAQNVFTDTIQVSFDIPTQDTKGLEFCYTLDGSNPTLEAALYDAPFTLTETTLVKVRAFRKGLKATPYRQCGTDSSETFHALFTREATRPAAAAADTVPGLEYVYYEDTIWPRLFAHAGVDGVLDVVARGTVGKLLDADDVAKTRRTDGPYAIVYRGYIEAPKIGVYAFHAPQHLYDVTMDAGFDLRVFVAGEEWQPTARLHAENTWYVPLAAGKHRFEVRFVDFRHKTWRNEWWMTGRKEIVWQGIPVLEVSGPDLDRQPVPNEWLRHRGPSRADGSP